MVGSNSAVTLWPIVCFGFTCEGDGYVAVVTYLTPDTITPENATAINGAIVIAGTAAIEICTKFVKAE